MVGLAVVDMPIVEVVHVAVVAYRDVPAVCTMFVVVRLRAPVVSDSALVVVPVVGMVQVSLVQVVDVAEVFHRGVLTVRSVDMCGCSCVRCVTAIVPVAFLHCRPS